MKVLFAIFPQELGSLPKTASIIREVRREAEIGVIVKGERERKLLEERGIPSRKLESYFPPPKEECYPKILKIAEEDIGGAISNINIPNSKYSAWNFLKYYFIGGALLDTLQIVGDFDLESLKIVLRLERPNLLVSSGDREILERGFLLSSKFERIPSLVIQSGGIRDDEAYKYITPLGDKIIVDSIQDAVTLLKWHRSSPREIEVVNSLCQDFLIPHYREKMEARKSGIYKKLSLKPNEGKILVVITEEGEVIKALKRELPSHKLVVKRVGEFTQRSNLIITSLPTYQLLTIADLTICVGYFDVIWEAAILKKPLLVLNLEENLGGKMFFKDMQFSEVYNIEELTYLIKEGWANNFLDFIPKLKSLEAQSSYKKIASIILRDGRER